MLRRLVKISLLIVGVLVVAVMGLMVYVRIAARATPPDMPASTWAAQQITEPDSGLYTLGPNWFRQSESGLYELYVEGSPHERGVANGRLTRDLVHYQEEVFNAQINRMVPSAAYRGMLQYFVGWFNRHLDRSVPEEYRQEIKGVSEAASPAFDHIAPAYQRILNYHAAHDIGHALQNMSLVGCTSFATWGAASADSSLIVGRNFDFYVGDDFARDKIVAFYKPDNGHAFMMVTFGGMTGVLSGMNVKGLTVTINAAKCDVPGASATPVSLVAREMLQYASTIEEAYAIARKRHMFVAESFLVASARDGKAAIIEKTPDAIGYFESGEDRIICTNHFQSDSLRATELNREHMRTSASTYRYQRVAELLDSVRQNSVQATAGILRNQRGLHGADIGMGNEKLVNQLVAHHAVIFQPQQLRVWVSTAPWQLGKFVCYDLQKIFTVRMTQNAEVYEPSLTIAADTFLTTNAYEQYRKFSRYRFPFAPRTGMHADSVVTWNRRSYHAYMLAGDERFAAGDFRAAAAYYLAGLDKEIATVQEREHMEKNLEKCKEQLP